MILPRSRPRGGFTLVEILATMALMSIVLPPVMEGIRMSTEAEGWARRRTQAAELARDKAEELVATRQLQQAILSGDFGADWPEFTWSAAVTDWDTTLKQVAVTVTWRRDARSHQVTVTTLAKNSNTVVSGTTSGGTP